MPKISKACQQCGSQFQTWPRPKKERRFCSVACANESKRNLERACVVCGTMFRPRWYGKARFCGMLCAHRWTAKNRKTTKGYVITAKGYKALYLPSHPRAMKTGYLLEHRLVAEGIVGRPLKTTEVVHHLNGDRMDNRPENLEILDRRVHDQRPMPPVKPIVCPHCGGLIRVSGRVRNVEPIFGQTEPSSQGSS